MTTPTIIGIDQSLSHTVVHVPCGVGSGVLDVRACRSVSIKTEKKGFAHPVARLHHILFSFQDVLDTLQLDRCGHAGLAYIEGYGFASQMAHALGELGGALKLALYEYGWTIVNVPPSTLKKFVTGKGNAEKDTMMLECFKRWGYSATDNNDCDAYCLRQFGLAHQGIAACTKAQAECFKKLEVWEPRRETKQAAE